MCADSRGTSDGEQQTEIALGLYWRIKDSFVRYVLSGAGGTYSVTGGAEDDERGNFFFPLESAQHDPTTGWEIKFSGDVRFAGHHGALFVTIIDPIVTLHPDGGTLSIRQLQSAGAPESADDKSSRIVIGTVTSAEPQNLDGLLAWPPLETALTDAGVSFFGDVYPVGAPTDPLKIAIASS